MKSLEEAVEIANPENPHCPVLLLLDTSGSMSGEKIHQLNEGIKLFKEEVQKDDIASKRVDVAVITFDSDVKVIHEFSSIEDFEPHELEASGSTSMGEAILTGIDIIEKRKNQYKQKGVDYYRPWIILITDGAPTDMSEGDEKWKQVVSKVHDGEKNKKFLFFCIGVEGADFDFLKKISPQRTAKLKGTKFKEFFAWLSKSQIRVSASKAGDKVKLEDPVSAGWGEIEV